MIHIVFNEADVETMRQAIGLDETLAGDVVLIRDDYALGPLRHIYDTEGSAERLEWWRQTLSGGDYEGLVEKNIVDDHAVVRSLLERLEANKEEVLWIWAAQNKHDVSGYYWLLHFLAPYQGRVFILYLNNLPFINEKGQLFYPQWLMKIPPREFSKAKKLARPITASEFEVDADEWKRLCAEDKGVRVLEGGKKLVQYDYDFYDADLLKFVTDDWQKAGKIIHQFLARNTHTTGDAYLLWRLKHLASRGEVDVQGELRGMKDFELKRKVAVIEPQL